MCVKYPSVLSLTEKYSDNLGDQLLSECARELILEYVPHVDARDYSYRELLTESNVRPSSYFSRFIKTRLAKSVSQILPNALQNLIRILLNFPKAFSVAKVGYEFAFIGGGQLILSNKLFPSCAFLWVFMLKRYGTKIYFLGIGVGEKYGVFDRLLFRYALGRADKIYVRDMNSKKNLLGIFGLHSKLIPDIAYIKASDRKKDDFTSNLIVIFPVSYEIFQRYRGESSINVASKEEYLHYWTSKVEHYISEGFSVQLSGSALDDLRFCREITDYQSAEKKKIVTIEHIYKLHDLADLIRRADLVLSARMHVLIYAHVLGTAFEPIVISKKIASFVREYATHPSEVMRAHVYSEFSELAESIGL